MSSSQELNEYIGFAGRQRRDTALHVLNGFLAGIELDHLINVKEHRELRDWIADHERLAARDLAFSELLKALRAAIADGKLEPDEIADLRTLCQRARTDSPYYDAITHAIQELHGILHGVIADLSINKEELSGLQDWIETNSHLRGVWPVTEIESVVVKVLSDQRIDEAEHRLMLNYFSQFTNLSVNSTLKGEMPALLPTDLTISGICAVDPEIAFTGKLFCFTGVSSRGPRQFFAETVTRAGGGFVDRITNELDYLIIGDEGNPCWAFTCYGRKVEHAVQMRLKGHRILLVHEQDFWDALS